MRDAIDCIAVVVTMLLATVALFTFTFGIGLVRCSKTEPVFGIVEER